MAGAATRARGKPRLSRYAQKRDFARTLEPDHRTTSRAGKALKFVVQKHAARRLHWDFRLEWAGTLRSWAVPKGPSLDPADKRLAVEVEDHPLAYAAFEGDIPKGQYGGGHVDIWDQGTWTPVGDFRKGLTKGHLQFELQGEKLAGQWHLVRTRLQGKQPNWLLMKSDDQAARVGATADVIDAGHVPRTARPPRRAAPSKTRAARGKALPATLEPQLATLVDKVPDEEGWVFELKYDGVRLLSRCDGEDVRCISRNGIDWTHKVGGVGKALAGLALDKSWVDGELIVTDANGRTDFTLLQKKLEQGRHDELQYCVFDLLYHRGKDLRALPLEQRKARLDTAFDKLPAGSVLRLADQIHSDSSGMMMRVCNQHLEGLIAKKTGSPYQAGRSSDWLKIKCHREQEFVVGGIAFMPGRGTGTFASLLVGVKSGTELKYAGRVGGGFDTRERAEWKERASKLARASSPFRELPDKRSGEMWRWMKPQLVIQVAFAGWTQGGVLRQPRYLGLRQDIDPGNVVREEPVDSASILNRGAVKKKTTRAAVPSTRLTHPERVLYPHDGITKQQLAEYFAAVGEVAMPHYLGRPLSILRNTHGTRPFFQKHYLNKSGDGLRVVTIRNADKDPRFVVCDSPAGLLHLAQVGAVELHSWGARMPKPTRADRLTFDLDPGEGLAYPPLRDAALAIRTLLQDLDLECWVKTSGGKGLHVVVPLAPPLPDWPTAKEFTRSVTRFMERLAPTLFTSKTGERNRKGKIFVDYLRNGFGATAVAAYSPRWRPGVGVSTPVAWDELQQDIRGTHFNIRNIPDRVARQRQDPWKGYWKSKQSLSRAQVRDMAAR